MRALVLNCTLKPSPATSNTEALAKVVVEALEGHDWSASTGKAAAGNLVAVARALQATTIPPPAGS